MSLECNNIEERSVTTVRYYEKSHKITGIFTGRPFSACALIELSGISPQQDLIGRKRLINTVWKIKDLSH